MKMLLKVHLMYIRVWCGLLLALGAGGAAQAQTCTSVNGGITRFTLPSSLSIVENNTPIGGALTDWFDTPRTLDFNCDWGRYDYYTVGEAGGVATYSEAGLDYTVYDTLVPGVGVVVYNDDGLGRMGAPVRAGAELQTFSSSFGDTHVLANRVKVRFIRTSTLKSGSYTYSDQQIATNIPKYAGVPIGAQRILLGGGVVNVTATARPSCTFIGPTSVSLGSVAQSQFSGMGATAGERDYTVSLGCPAGVGAIVYQIQPTTTEVDREQGLAEVTGGAAGVSMQFLDDQGAPVKFLDALPFGDGGNPTVTKNFKVRYKRTGAVIRAGTANAGLTYVFTYP